MNGFVALRVLTGALFIVSGFEKLSYPYQNFAYVIESYSVVPFAAVSWIARVLPWVEFGAGVLFVVGLRTIGALNVIRAMFALFLVVVGQAMVRKLPVGDCGCFGENFSLPLPAVFAMDLTFLVLLTMASLRPEKLKRFSLDALWR